ncbi:MAG: lysophospholipid acyltransferase family protein [Chloroflexota bacterium]
MSAVGEARVVTAARRGGRGSSLGGRVKTRLLIGGAWVLRHVPSGLAHRAADLLGGILYRVQPARRALVRSNLERVVRYLAEHDMANDATAAAARDPRALDRLVRAAFGHWVRGYLESATLPAYASEKRLDHVRADDQDLVAQAFTPSKPAALIVIGMHFGAIEIPGLWATKRLGVRMTAPMETIGDPALQAYFERARSETGMNVIPVAGAASALRNALERTETVALVADRPIGGSGISVELFGAPARLPAGPAVLALESGAPAWLIVTRRVGWSEYRSRLERIEAPAGDSRRERLAAFMAAEARAFERAVADAPEQWWTVFFPIWSAAS